MPVKKKIWLSWSSGKDSAYTLFLLQKSEEYEVTALFTSINAVFDRVAMHSVRTSLLRKQVESIGLPLHCVSLPHPCTMEDYEKQIHRLIAKSVEEGVCYWAFGDLFLEDVKAYRMRQLADSGITPVFPLWGQDTKILAKCMLQEGFRAVITCIDNSQLTQGFCGRRFDEAFLGSLPPEVDPCGERGEFHSFVYEAPIFKQPISFQLGETLTREGFTYQDLWVSFKEDYGC